MDIATAPFTRALSSFPSALPPPFERSNINGIKKTAVKIPAVIAAAKIHLILSSVSFAELEPDCSGCFGTGGGKGGGWETEGGFGVDLKSRSSRAKVSYHWHKASGMNRMPLGLPQRMVTFTLVGGRPA